MRFFLFLTDTLAFILAFVAGRFLAFQFGELGYLSPAEWWQTYGQIRSLMYGLLCFGGLMWIHGQLRHYTLRKPYWTEVQELLVFVSFMAVLDATLMYMTKQSFSRLSWMFTWLLFLPSTLTLRSFARVLFRKLGVWNRQYVVIGSGENASEAIAAISDDKWMGYECIAAMSVPAVRLGLGAERRGQGGVRQQGNVRLSNDSLGNEIPVESFPDNMDSFLTRFGKADIIVAVEEEEWASFKDLIDYLAIRVRHLYIVPSIRGLPLLGTDVSYFFSHEVLLLRVRNNLARKVYKDIKRIVDVIGALSGLIILFPFMMTIAWFVSRNGNSIFFKHERIGQNGKVFSCYKYTTMVANAHQVLADLLSSDAEARAEWDKNFKLKNDPRVTALGSFMRRTSIDELPQLWNVLKGEMSLVGPRPIVESELARYGKYQQYYLEAKPGITGLWQVSGRSDTEYSTRVALDVWYAKNWSLWYDFVILVRTVSVVFTRKGAV